MPSFPLSWFCCPCSADTRCFPFLGAFFTTVRPPAEFEVLGFEGGGVEALEVVLGFGIKTMPAMCSASRVPKVEMQEDPFLEYSVPYVCTFVILGNDYNLIDYVAVCPECLSLIIVHR